MTPRAPTDPGLERDTPRSGAPGEPRVELDFDWVTDDLAIGGCLPAAGAAAALAEAGVTHVVDLRAESRDDRADLRRHGLGFLHIPTADTCALTPARLHRGVTWIRAALDRGGRVLVHCQYGIGRSALVAMAVMVSRGTPILDALERAKDRRAIVSPSPEQLQALMAYARRLSSDVIAAASLPTFEALAAIAYRHLRQSGSEGAGTEGGNTTKAMGTGTAAPPTRPSNQPP